MEGRKKGNSKKLVRFKRNFFPEILKLTAGSTKIPQGNFATFTRACNAGWCLCATEVCLLNMEENVLWTGSSMVTLLRFRLQYPVFQCSRVIGSTSTISRDKQSI